MTYRILRTDGTEEVVEGRATLDSVKRSINADVIDVVTLTFGPGRIPDLVMIVDDTGMIDHRPFNERASAAAHTDIYGDAVIAHDQDFGDAP